MFPRNDFVAHYKLASLSMFLAQVNLQIIMIRIFFLDKTDLFQLKNPSIYALLLFSRHKIKLYGTLRHIFYLLEQVGPFCFNALIVFTDVYLCVGIKCIRTYLFLIGLDRSGERGVSKINILNML